jgi:hypothetical protein
MFVFDDHRQFLTCNIFSKVVGDIVTGRTSVPYVLPKDVSNVTVFLVTRDGLRLTKVQSKRAADFKTKRQSADAMCSGQRHTPLLQPAGHLRHTMLPVFPAQLIHVSPLAAMHPCSLFLTPI